jgi:HIV Tat-specific factor 1
VSPCIGSLRRLTWISKLADWDDDDPQALEQTSSRQDKVVILKHMFTLQELEVGIAQCVVLPADNELGGS